MAPAVSQVAPVIATKKPTTVEAWQWDGTVEQADRIMAWIAEANKHDTGYGQVASLHTHENIIILGDNYEAVKPGMYIIRDQFNEFWPLPADVYRAIYASPV